MVDTEVTKNTFKLENVSEETSLEALQTIPFDAKSFHIWFAARGLEYGSFSRDKKALNEFRQRNVVPFLEVQLKYREFTAGETPFYSEVRRSEIGEGGISHLSSDTLKDYQD